MNIVQTNDLCKKYGEELANDHISIHVEKQSIYGLIGHNGAGKTTLLRQLGGILSSTSGECVWNEGGERPRVSMTLPTEKLDNDLTVEKTLLLYGNLGTTVTPQRVTELISLLHMENYRKKKIRNLSTGMKQRVVIALAVVDSPELLILDEPTNGLDPMGIKEIRELLLDLKQKEKISIIVSSHNLGELAKISDRYGVIAHGRLVSEFEAGDIANMSEDQMELHFIRMMEGNA